MSEQLKPEVIVAEISNNLQISEDTGLDGNPTAVFLYTPDMNNTREHFHPEMNVEQASKLHAWLGSFLNKHSTIVKG